MIIFCFDWIIFSHFGFLTIFYKQGLLILGANIDTFSEIIIAGFICSLGKHAVFALHPAFLGLASNFLSGIDTL